ncbi:MAG: 16S rRNA (guanine(527)-N(7))-methyltransferase RsmG [Burkholderiaceae bacterium]|nr:16S rRNA (guanine(527)-N(7))-methyltransferase RsmG [Burkholderiaceae bacterium]
MRDAEQMLVQHIFDCAAVAGPLKRLVERQRADRSPEIARPRVLDVGSGAGLPGVVLALLWPEADFVLVEPVAKKAAFLQQLKNELALANIEVVRCRVEELPSTAKPPDAIVCRAFASLADYATAVEALVAPHTVVTAMKAHPDEREKRALTHDWRIADEIALRVPELDARRSLVVLERGSCAKKEQELRE